MRGHQLVVLVLQLLALEGGQAAQLHVEDRLRLDLGQRELLDQALAGHVGGLGRADQRDDLVDGVQRDQQALDDVGAVARLAQPVGGAPFDDLDLVGDVVAQRLVQRQRARHAVDQREAVDAEGVLQLGVLVQLVEHDLGVGVALELDDDAHALAGGLVAQVGDPGDGLGVDQVGDLLEQPGLVDHVGDLGDHDPLAFARAAGLLDLADGTDLDRPTAGGERLVGAGLAEDQPAGREVGRRDVLHQVDGGQRVVVDAARPWRRSARRGCAAGCWWPCRRRCRWSRWRAGWGTGPAGRPAPARSRRSWRRGRRSPRRCRAAAPWPGATGATRCTASPRAGRRRRSRSCRARRSARSGSRSPGPCGPARRRSPSRRAGGTSSSRRRPRRRTCGTARWGAGPSRPSSTGCGGAPA